MKELLVAGLGNLCISDDAIGVHIVRALRAVKPGGCLLAEIGTALFSVLHLLESAQRILIIDAAHGQKPAGTIYPMRTLKAAQPPAWTALREVELQRALDFLPAIRRPEIMIIGVEPLTLEYGVRLSPVLCRLFPKISEEVQKTVADLTRVEWFKAGKAGIKDVQPVAVEVRQAEA